MTTHWVHQLPTVGGQTIIHNLHPEFLLPFRMQWEDSDTMLASTQETLLIKKVNNILIQATTRFWRKELLFQLKYLNPDEKCHEHSSHWNSARTLKLHAAILECRAANRQLLSWALYTTATSLADSVCNERNENPALRTTARRKHKETDDSSRHADMSLKIKKQRDRISVVLTNKTTVHTACSKTRNGIQLLKIDR
jgi:hypothetical protein